MPMIQDNFAMPMIRSLSSAIAIAIFLLLPAGCLVAEEMPALATSGAAASWVNLGSEALPQYTKDLLPWKKGIPAQSGDTRLVFTKLSGSGYTTALGIYAGSADYVGPLAERILSGKITEADLPALKADDFVNPGIFQISTSSPLQGLQTVTFLIRIKGFAAGQHFTPFELIERIFPATLSYNDGTQSLTAARRKRIASGISQGFPEETYALQWDLRMISEPIREFRLQWVTYPHSCTTGLRVEQADVFSELAASQPSPTPAR